ncbi:hypothetical protein EV702DRAFT_302170 [Suillus placidus]|uniref:HMG box domain-containing protein n=1 Tax=Suillus placidus TaxID=48579 RepID=A0A9P6ZUK3_9AGAM|nr:hypothetical protein EV702DRAFT_302170 [Suillus placidus]
MTGPIRSKGKARASDDEEVMHPPQLQPPRPPNAWILYRSDKIKVLPPAEPGQRNRAQADVSKLISDMWRNESDAVKLEYERLADARKAEHQRLYPDYRFQPMKKEEKERLREEKRQRKERAREKKKPRGRAHAFAGPSQEQHEVVAQHPMQEPGPQQAAVAYAPPYFHAGVMPVQNVPSQIPHHNYNFFDPEMQYGLAGPSPPLSAVSSPNPSSASESSCLSDELLLRVDALSSARVSPIPDAQPRPSQQQPYDGLPSFPQSFPRSQHSYGMEPMPVQQPQAAYAQWQAPQAAWQAPQEHILPQPSGSGAAQQPAPEWDNFDASEGTFDYQQQDFLNFDLAANNLGSMQDLERSLQAMLSSTGQNGVFSMSNIKPADILAQPESELAVEMAPKPDAQSRELENYYNSFDIEAALGASQEHQASTVNPSGTVNPADTVINTNLSADDFTSFFQPNPDVQAYMAAQQRQRQPSAFTRDIMQFINFDAGEGGSQNAAAPQVGAPPPPTQQPQAPIFTQMTNTAAAVPQSGYVPPAGAVHSSTRRVGASWKPSYAIPDDSVIDPALFY